LRKRGKGEGGLKSYNSLTKKANSSHILDLKKKKREKKKSGGPPKRKGGEVGIWPGIPGREGETPRGGSKDREGKAFR